MQEKNDLELDDIINIGMLIILLTLVRMVEAIEDHEEEDESSRFNRP